MTISPSIFPQERPQREDQKIFSTTLPMEQKKKHPFISDGMNSFIPVQRNSGSEIFIDRFYEIDQNKSRSSIVERVPSNLLQPIGYQVNLIATDLKKRGGKFIPPQMGDLPKSLPRTHKKVADNEYLQRCQRLQEYLDSLKEEIRVVGETEFSEKVLNLSWLVWEALKSSFDSRGQRLNVPDACPGLKDNFMYTWSKSEHYLECEIFGNGEIEFFYRHRNTGEVWGEDTTLEQGFSTDILDKAALFMQ
jgi:hypothetical protein